MSSRTIKKLLLSLIVVGILSTFTVGGTFAIFNGQTNDPNQTFQTGSMVMTNTVGAGAPCYSDLVALNDNTNAACTTLFSTGLLYPIASTSPLLATVAYANVAIASSAVDAGSNPINSTLDSTLSVYMSRCDATDNATVGAIHGGVNPCCPGDAFGATNVLPGTFNPCPVGSLDFFIQEYTDNTFTTPKPNTCAFPVSTVAVCAYADNTLGNFFGPYHASSNTLSLGPLTHGTTRYFRVVVAEPIDASNGLQGETATLSLVWHMQ